MSLKWFNVLLFLSLGLSGSGQVPFVFFESTARSSEICQGKAVGIIATINPQIGNYINFKWSGDSKDIKEIKNEIVIVNSTEPGEKRLKFSLIVNENIKYDTTYILKVLPKPEISLQDLNNVIRITNKSGLSLSGFKWKYNGVMIIEETDSILRNPKKGSYQVFVMDSNGCRGSSQIKNVE